ncbi:MAG: hypothetical protein EAZ95_13990 [Bacteroidetes bacterium]|nr:MAG: hypothetical protein EAZ95_13990 [Bacteroidota bacterium]
MHGLIVVQRFICVPKAKKLYFYFFLKILQKAIFCFYVFRVKTFQKVFFSIQNAHYLLKSFVNCIKRANIAREIFGFPKF